MMDTTIDALKNLFVALGGSAETFKATIIPDAINAIAGFVGIKDINVQPEKSTTDFWGTKASAMQTGLSVADGAITGTLKYLAEGELVTYWGAGNFMALKFVDPNENTDYIEVRMNPTGGAGWVKLDSDMNGVFKVADTEQKFEVRTVMKDGVSKVQIFDLSGLTLESA